MNYVWNGKDTTILLIIGYIKRKPSINEWVNCLGANVKIELALSNYATEAHLKNATGVDVLDFAKKTDLANLQSDVDKIDIDQLKNVPSCLSSLKSKINKLGIGKLKTTPVDLSKLNNVLKVMLFKRWNI